MRPILASPKNHFNLPKLSAAPHQTQPLTEWQTPRITPVAIVSSAKKSTGYVQLGSGLNNLTTLELSRKLNEIYADFKPKLHPLTGMQLVARDPALAALKDKFNSGRKADFVKQFNFTDIENPFLNSDFTL